MDLPVLVDGGVDGLSRIVNALEADGLEVQGAYLKRETSDTGYEDFVFCIVTPNDQRAVINSVVDLKRAGKFPRIDENVRFTAARPTSLEASRIMNYAARVGRPILTLQGVGLDGLYIEDAIVVKWPKHKHVAA